MARQPGRGLTEALGQWRRANQSAAAAREALRAAVAAAVDEGMSQSEVARVLGWPRQRVSKVLSER